MKAGRKWGGMTERHKKGTYLRWNNGSERVTKKGRKRVKREEEWNKRRERERTMKGRGEGNRK